MDPLRKSSRLVEGLLRIACHLFEERLRRGGIGVDQAGKALKVDGDCHEMLLHAAVQFALDEAAICDSGQDQSLP